VERVLPPVVVDDVRPRTPALMAAKGTVGEPLPVAATLIADGHDRLAARVRWRRRRARGWRSEPLRDVGNDRWVGELTPSDTGAHEVVIEAWVDRYATWRHEVQAKVGAGVDVTLELEEGARILDDLADGLDDDGAAVRVREAAAGLRATSCSVDVRLNAGLDDEVAGLVAGVPDAKRSVSAPHPVWVERRLAAVGAWYELFPRSFGGFDGAAAHLDYVADLGFDIVYLPPIHPIGRTHRKGRDNTLTAGPDDVGSPWAIGGETSDGTLGGHTAIHPDLGTEDDLRAFVDRARELGLEVALDYALQCSPDHPWVHEHPEWFTQRPDGSIRYAENPPKKYQDIHPIDFWPERDEDRAALWEACYGVLEHWIDHGIEIFRVDNPHTKPVAFWTWVIERLRKEHPDVVLLAEAFTRPAMMSKLGEIGFSQGYTYYTWRTEPWELRDYVIELTAGDKADWFRPAFWPNTPDILSGPLRDGPPAAFMLRLVLAATLVPTYGVYSGYELCENVPASDTNEEYKSSEKYELKDRDYGAAGSLAPLMRKLNEVRRAHPDLWALRDVRFHHSDDDAFLVYSRGHVERDLLLCVVNLDPHHARETTVRLDVGALGLPRVGQHQLRDELTGERYTWSGDAAYVRLDPHQGQVAHVLHVAAAP
jgi:starch synthase (maltosyl-transferring)